MYIIMDRFVQLNLLSHLQNHGHYIDNDDRDDNSNGHLLVAIFQGYTKRFISWVDNSISLLFLSSFSASFKI